MAFVYPGCTKEVVDVARRRDYWHLQRHGSNLVAASQNCAFEHFEIAEFEHFEVTECLHPSEHIATIFWDRIAQDSWSEVCREAVGAILSGLNLGQWQDSMMKQSLQDLKTQFRVEPGQPGFFFTTTKARSCSGGDLRAAFS